MRKPVAVLPLKRARGRYYDSSRSLYCVVGAQDRQAARRWQECQAGVFPASDFREHVAGLTGYHLTLVNDGLYDAATSESFAAATPTERTMFLALLMQAAGYTVKVVER